MNPKFYPKKAHFESKSIIAPNALIFNHDLTETAKIFILVLHAISTCAPTWIAIQEDLKRRLGWGREKMDSAIACCVKFGFLKVKQSRNKIGRFLHNEFIFDIDGQLLTYTDDETNPGLYDEEEELKKCLPKTGFPTSDEQASDNQPLPVLVSEPTLENIPFTTTIPPPTPASLPNPNGGGGLQSSVLFYTSVSGGIKQILVSEVHRQFIRKDLAFDSSIIDQAIEEVRGADHRIGNIISYLSSICARIVNKTYQNIKENKNLKTALISPKVDEKLPDIRCGKSVWEMMQEREKKNETI